MKLSLMNKKTLVAGTVALAALTPSLALAGLSPDEQIFGTSCGFLNSIQGWIFGAAYVIGAIGLVIIAVSAFLGRFKFSHLIALGGGLFIVAAADLLLSFATGGTGGVDSCDATAGSA